MRGKVFRPSAEVRQSWQRQGQHAVAAYGQHLLLHRMPRGQELTSQCTRQARFWQCSPQSMAVGT